MEIGDERGAGGTGRATFCGVMACASEEYGASSAKDDVTLERSEVLVYWGSFFLPSPEISIVG